MSLFVRLGRGCAVSIRLVKMLFGLGMLRLGSKAEVKASEAHCLKAFLALFEVPRPERRNEHGLLS